MKHYEAAVGILHGQLKGKEKAVSDATGETEADTRKNIVRVLIAMVEIWMSPVYELWYAIQTISLCEVVYYSDRGLNAVMTRRQKKLVTPC